MSAVLRFFQAYYSYRARLNCVYAGVRNCLKMIHKKFMSFDSIRVEQHEPGISVTSKNMEMCSKSMCININTAECSGVRRIICAMDIYAVTRNELAVTLPSREKLIKLQRFCTEERERRLLMIIFQKLVIFRVSRTLMELCLVHDSSEKASAPLYTWVLCCYSVHGVYYRGKGWRNFSNMNICILHIWIFFLHEKHELCWWKEEEEEEERPKPQEVAGTWLAIRRPRVASDSCAGDAFLLITDVKSAYFSSVCRFCFQVPQSELTLSAHVSTVHPCTLYTFFAYLRQEKLPVTAQKTPHRTSELQWAWGILQLCKLGSLTNGETLDWFSSVQVWGEGVGLGGWWRGGV